MHNDDAAKFWRVAAVNIGLMGCWKVELVLLVQAV